MAKKQPKKLTITETMQHVLANLQDHVGCGMSIDLNCSLQSLLREAIEKEPIGYIRDVGTKKYPCYIMCAKQDNGSIAVVEK